MNEPFITEASSHWRCFLSETNICSAVRWGVDVSLRNTFCRLLESTYLKWKCYQKCLVFFLPKPSESCFVVKARGVPSSSPLEEVFLSFFSHPTEGHSQCFGSFATQNIFLSLSRPSLSPPPHWCVSRRTQGQCLTEPWMLFSCHTFPKRLAAAPIVATEGGLLSWSFRPPAVALVSDGFIVRECGPNNGQRHDVMLLMWAKSLCRYVVGFRCVEHIRKDISDLPFGLQIGQQIFFFLPRIQNVNNCCFY